MDEIVKERTRGRRRSLTKNAIEKQKRIARAHGMRVRKSHRYAKMSATNCGIPGCIHCANPRRVWRQKTIQELKADEAMEEWSGKI